MRPIKFRAWDGRRMIYPTKIELIHADKSFTRKPGYNCDDHLGIPCENLMQYTGLQDKNGKEIWESDVVKWKCLSTSFKGVEEGVGKIRYMEDRGAFNCAKLIETHDFRVNNFEHLGYSYKDISKLKYDVLEVLGNIYENPELIKEKE